MTPSPQDDAPFGRIALSFSGGGGRAAGFHLGTLVYLDRADILEDVTILSTVSGGSFVGASYALALKQAPDGEDRHVTFRNYFESFKEVLQTAKLLPWALKHMTSGCDSLVTALAQVYNDTFLKNARFGIFWGGRDIHLKDIIFNATEFRTGAAFRFQKSDHPCVIGNDRVCISADYAKQMRLADVVASSSCIPVGLEPLNFPDDFRWPADSPGIVAAIKADLKRQCGNEDIPIMDGGVYDNQGIESALLAVRRDPRHPAAKAQAAQASLTEWFQPLLASPAELGTFIVSDAPLVSDIGLDTAAPPLRTRTLTLRQLDILTRVVMLLAVFTIVYMLGHLLFSTNQLRPTAHLDDFLAYAIPMTVSAVVLAGLAAARRTVTRLLSAFPQSGHHAWTDLRHLRVAQVVEMLRLRLSSTWALTSWVYFNRIRQLGFDLLRALPGAKRHLIAHEIADLTVEDPSLPAWLAPSPAAAALARRASTMATQLWFDEPEDLDDAIFCGRMTMCFNVLRHLELNFPARTASQQRLYDRARADWAILQAEPRAMLAAEGRA